MIASAPGKLVLSGAYVVLDGAPAVVAAVDRRAWADAARVATFQSEELRAAFPERPAPMVDTLALRADNRKLGLGSSAALLVAAVVAVALADEEVHEDDLDALAALGAERAFRAHRRAQGGGSGIDVVTCAYGGIRLCHVDPLQPENLPRSEPLSLPTGLVLEAWICPTSASTAQLLRPVRALASSDPSRYRTLTLPGHDGAEMFERGCREDDIETLLHGARRQRDSMLALGHAAGAPILPPYLIELDRMAHDEHALIAQSGAGGGDIALYFGRAPSSSDLRAAAAARGLRLLTPLAFGTLGVCAGFGRDLA